QINVLRGDFNKQEENLRRNLKDDMRSILRSFFQNQPSTSGTLLSNTVPNPKGEMKAVTTRSGLAYEGPSIPTESPLEKVDEQNTEEILDKELLIVQEEENLKRNLKDDMRSILGSFFQNQPSTSGNLLSNTVPNPKGEMKAVTTRSGLAYEGPSIPTESSLEKVDEQNTEEILDKELLIVQEVPLKSNLWLNDQKLREKATNQMEKFFQIFHDLHFDISFADALLLMPKFTSTIKSLLASKDKLFELAKVPLNENCSAMLLKKLPEKLGDPGKFLIPYDFPGMEVCHALTDLGASINLMPLSIWKKLSLPELTPTRMTLELADRVDVIDIAYEDFVQDVLDFQYNSKSSSPTLVSDDLISESDTTEESKEKSSVEEPPKLELKELPSHLEYAFLEDSNKLTVIIAKNLKVDEREALINVLKSHKRAIAWKISDIKVIWGLHLVLLTYASIDLKIRRNMYLLHNFRNLLCCDLFIFPFDELWKGMLLPAEILKAVLNFLLLIIITLTFEEDIQSCGSFKYLAFLILD
nr:reverse transcriptase domain-containing protein [Tanacetum cinerariifolium]